MFDYQGKQVRTVVINDEPWFVAKDVCEVLEMSNHNETLKRLDDDEKGVNSIDTLGGVQELLVVNESGLYNLVMGSRKKEAKQFKRWITHDVLPAIRKTGTYTANPMSIEDLIIAQATSVKELKAQVTEIAGTVQQLQAAQEKKADITSTLPPVNEKSLRANINSIVRSYASRNKYDFRDTFGTLYREFYYRYSIDLKTRARNRNCNPFDVAEADGCLKELLSLAITLFA